MSSQLLCTLLLAVLLSLSVGAGAAESEKSLLLPYERPALVTDEARKAITIGLAAAGNRLVAVGERGVILLSDDHGRSWRQAPSPVSVTLTAVDFANEKLGWTVGHSGVVLHTRDGGETWNKQFDGILAAQAIADRVEKITANMNEDDAWPLQDYASQMVQDGPDKPFLDVLFRDESEGFIIGAFGLAFYTRDAGKNWQPWFDQIENPELLHLYKLSTNGKSVVMVGEQGLYLRADGPVRQFVQHQTPYSGSFFTVAPLRSGDWLLAGLRGNAFIHSPADDHYQQLQVDSEITINDSFAVAEDRVLLVNQAGNIYQAQVGSPKLRPIPMRPLPPTADLISSGDGAFVAATFRGPTRFDAQIESTESGEQ